MDRKQSIQMLGEMKLFAGLSAAEQRYIRRSLDVGLMRGDAVSIWARNSAGLALFSGLPPSRNGLPPRPERGPPSTRF